MDNTTVKLDAGLLKRVKSLLQRDPYRIRYANLKHFINLAVLHQLEKELLNDQKKGGDHE